jgi:uncharacterized protein (DUF2249 family)
VRRRPEPVANRAPAPEPKPAALAAIPATRRVSLDVRDAIRRGEEPFATIMAAVARLRDEQVLVLRAPFEPVPLYRVLAKRGFAHWTERRTDDDWLVSFYRGEPAESAPSRASSARDTLDVRGLEPPRPMVAVLERLETLAPGQTLTVVHDRRPTFLYPQLDARGFAHRTDEPEPGLIRIVIERPVP